MSIIHLIIVRFLTNFPFAIGTVATDSFLVEFAKPLMRLLLQTLDRIQFGRFLKRSAFPFLLHGFLLHPFYIKAFFIQVNKDMFLKIDGA